MKFQQVVCKTSCSQTFSNWSHMDTHVVGQPKNRLPSVANCRRRHKNILNTNMHYTNSKSDYSVVAQKIYVCNCPRLLEWKMLNASRYLTPSCCSNSMASVCAYRNTLVSFNATEHNSTKRSLNLAIAVMYKIHIKLWLLNYTCMFRTE